MFTTLLVPIDGSRHAQQALKVAAELARGGSTTLYLLHVVETMPDNIGILAGGSTLPTSEAEGKKLDDELRKTGLRVLDEAKRSIDLDGLEVKELVRRGRAGERIVDAAEELGVDAIVMGSRGMSDLKGMVVGSVSHRVGHAADCSVIIVT